MAVMAFLHSMHHYMNRHQISTFIYTHIYAHLHGPYSDDQIDICPTQRLPFAQLKPMHFDIGALRRSNLERFLVVPRPSSLPGWHSFEQLLCASWLVPPISGVPQSKLSVCVKPASWCGVAAGDIYGVASALHNRSVPRWRWCTSRAQESPLSFRRSSSIFHKKNEVDSKFTILLVICSDYLSLQSLPPPSC